MRYPTCVYINLILLIFFYHFNFISVLLLITLWVMLVNYIGEIIMHMYHQLIKTYRIIIEKNTLTKHKKYK